MKKKANEDLKSSIPKSIPILGFIILIIIIVILWILSLIIISKQFETWSDRGTFGDSFGVINSLFSGLAFAGIIYTILLQRKELSLQREELIATREELKRSAEAQERSEKEFRRQADNLKITAKLNALNTLVNHYSNEISTNIHSMNNPQSPLVKRDNYIEQIEDILAGKGGNILRE